GTRRRGVHPDTAPERRSPDRHVDKGFLVNLPVRRPALRGSVRMHPSPAGSGTVPVPGPMLFGFASDVWRRDAADTRSRDGCATWLLLQRAVVRPTGLRRN